MEASGDIITHVGGERDQQQLAGAIKRADFIIAHNAKFELQWLERCGLDISKLLVYDTLLGEWIIAGNRRIPKDLNSTAERYGVGEKDDVVARLIKAGVDTQNIPTKWLAEYCEQDVRITAAVFLKQRELLEERGQLHLQYARCLLTPVLADIEANGVTLDRELVLEEHSRITAEHREVEGQLARLGEELGMPAINWRSRKQVGEFLYDKLGFSQPKHRGEFKTTAGGARPTDSATIESLVATTAGQRQFKESFKNLAKLSARLTKSLNFYKEVCDSHEGTFYGIFNQGSTGTHRLSSSGRKIKGQDGKEYSAQLQNQPREYKRLVKAKKEGWEIWEIDASGLEFRMAADLARDTLAFQEIHDGSDIHQNTFDALKAMGFNVKDRTDAKQYSFKPLFGGKGAPGSPERAYSEFFQKKYSAIFKEQTAWTYDVLAKKELRTACGMIFYWPSCSVDKWGNVSYSTEIFNYPVKNISTGEVIPGVLAYVWHALQDWNVRIILTIHDSIVLEIGPDVDKEALRKLLVEAFIEWPYVYMKELYGYDVKVELGCEIKAGTHWSIGKAEKFQKTLAEAA